MAIALTHNARAIHCMGTSVEDGWRESSRPELWAVGRLQRPADDCPTRASHPNPLLLYPAVHFSAPAMLPQEGGQAVEEMAQLAGIGFGWHRRAKPKAGWEARQRRDFDTALRPQPARLASAVDLVTAQSLGGPHRYWAARIAATRLVRRLSRNKLGTLGWNYD